eukprot:TRINITY_DN14959_c0_g1_i1.p1 TRINITY_DN14959_c0_g1~~TRINITY_DN14959_c0_g1_i1.p1  ORF type:complete len:738 (-),score=146.49 TRINITY_DN14959_c0_g1_i1:113-2326(-)
MDNYTITRVVGRGSYGSVYLCLDKRDGKHYVLKRVDTQHVSLKERRSAEQEVDLLSKLNHPNIVAYRESFIGKENELCIIMTYCEGGDLYARIKAQQGVYFTEKQILEWFVQMCLALKFVHDRKILHRDLKTQNVFLTKNDIVKLGDFGVARVLSGSVEMANTMIGTPYYLSPELCENKPYDYKSDIWALGCVLYEMTTLKHAFDAKDMCALVIKILKGSYPPIPEQYSVDLQTLIAAMLSKDATSRPTIVEILQLPFIMTSMKAFLQARAGLSNQDSTPAPAPVPEPIPEETETQRGRLEYLEMMARLRTQLEAEEHEKAELAAMLERVTRERLEQHEHMMLEKREKIKANMEQREKAKQESKVKQLMASELVKGRQRSASARNTPDMPLQVVPGPQLTVTPRAATVTLDTAPADPKTKGLRGTVVKNLRPISADLLGRKLAREVQRQPATGGSLSPVTRKPRPLSAQPARKVSNDTPSSPTSDSDSIRIDIDVSASPDVTPTVAITGALPSSLHRRPPSARRSPGPPQTGLVVRVDGRTRAPSAPPPMSPKSSFLTELDTDIDSGAAPEKVDAAADSVEAREIQHRAQQYEAALRVSDERIAALHSQLKDAESRALEYEREEAAQNDMQMLVDLCRQQIDTGESPAVSLASTRSESPGGIVGDGRLAERITQLRTYCTRALGGDVFALMYSFLKQQEQVHADDAVVQGELIRKFGAEHSQYGPYLTQLIFCENFE